MDAGYALKVPVDAIAEFRILTQSAPPEYGGTGGATTSVVTRSGGNQHHGSIYDFQRARPSAAPSASIARSCSPTTKASSTSRA
jgi:hypothetical protein